MADNDDKPESLSAALAGLRAKRAKLDAQIELLEELTGASSDAVPASGDIAASRQSDGQTIRPDEFFGMNILDATERYLSIMKKPQSLGSISTALDRGGLIHQSKNFGATVFTTLRRAEDRGDRVVRFQKQWALSSWYPNRPRPTKDETRKPKRELGKKRAAKRQTEPELTIARPKALEAMVPAVPQQVAS